MKLGKKNHFMLFLVCLLAGIFLTFYPTRRQLSTIISHVATQMCFLENKVQLQEEPWITVFVHGTFGSVLGLLSFSSLINDDLDGSLYRKINRKMRYDPFFYQEQPILQKGLIPLTDLEIKNCKIKPIDIENIIGSLIEY